MTQVSGQEEEEGQVSLEGEAPEETQEGQVGQPARSCLIWFLLFLVTSLTEFPGPGREGGPGPGLETANTAARMTTTVRNSRSSGRSRPRSRRRAGGRGAGLSVLSSCCRLVSRNHQ